MKEDNKNKTKQAVLSGAAALSGSVMGVMAEGVIAGEHAMPSPASDQQSADNAATPAIADDQSTDAADIIFADPSPVFAELSAAETTEGKIEILGAQPDIVETAEVLESCQDPEISVFKEPEADPLTQNLLEDNTVPRVPDPSSLDDLSSNDLPDYVNDANVDFFTDIV